MKSPLQALSATVLAMLTLCAGVATAQQTAKPIRVEGTVLNGRGEGAPNMEVRLVRPVVKGKKIIRRDVLQTTRSDADGRFRFESVKVDINDLLLAGTKHQGYYYEQPAYMNLSHQKQLGGPQINSENVLLPTFDSTTKPVPMTAIVHHLAIKNDGNQLKVVERFVWNNSGRKTFLGVGKEKVTVRLNIPQGARDVRVDPSVRTAKLVKTTEGYGVSMPIPPGLYEQPALIVNYTMDWPLQVPWSRGLDLSKSISYPTKFFFVAREPDDRALEVTAPKLQPDQQAPVPVGGDGPQERIVNAIGEPQADKPALGAGTKVAINIARPVSPLFYAMCLFVGALFLAVPATMVGTKRRAQMSERAELNGSAKTLEPSVTSDVLGASYAPTFESGHFPSARLQPLIEEIARLDEAHAAGTVGRAEYESQRAAFKAELIERMQSHAEAKA